MRAVDRLDRLGELLLADQQRDLDLEELALGGRGLGLGRRVELLGGLRRLPRPAREVGLEQVPVAGQAELGRGRLRQVHRLGLAVATVRGAGRLELGPVGQGLRQAEPQVLAQGRPVADGRHRPKPLDRVVEHGDGPIAVLGIARLEPRGLEPGLRLGPAEDRRLEPELPRQGQVRDSPG